jgi:hypothetical protein
MKNLGYVHRFPTLQENLQVCAVVAVPIYAWTILWLFWKLPSWLKFLAIDEILPIFAYALTTNLLESVLILAGLNLVCFILPERWFRDSFVPRSFLFVLPGLGYLMYYASLFGKETDPPASFLLWLPAVLVLSFLLSFFLSARPMVKNWIEVIADQLTVFLYLIIPLSLLALILVLGRNLI